MSVSYEVEMIMGRWTVTRYLKSDYAFHKDTVVVADCDEPADAFRLAVGCFDQYEKHNERDTTYGYSREEVM